VKPFPQYLIAAALLAAGMAHAADLTIDVTGLKNAKGKVLVAVYDRAEGFLKQPARVAAADAQEGKVSVAITGLPVGDYAFTAFHDQNGNGTLDKNPVGMPVEPYGFSNDAVGHYGPPSFDQARVHLSEKGSVATINLH